LLNLSLLADELRYILISWFNKLEEQIKSLFNFNQIFLSPQAPGAGPISPVSDIPEKHRRQKKAVLGASSGRW